MTRAPWSKAATSKAQRVRVEVFSKISAMFFRLSCGCSEPAYFATLSSAARSSRNLHSLGVKSTSLTKLRLRRLKAISDPLALDGQVMQRGPPRPRPSSLPRMVTTSMPFLRRKVLVVTLRS